ncbi:hypothetical protein MGYG_05054 [Nannizzia gypsea CBS 118893]|uniref:J domain-containing protein n=1 Tax=Arthroderma gypseum (strain ATCC MYA-4604 / CBS 118893) TaxID=535722 RepID=E4UY88_ARTGP|nr:hypothetical protein MGYG_05054 [Nannizzia gypsea CBS 118893]EFR02051.1 hypothetical protein MGYG_05054 [Nannizzia gypsea CBS 118893]
MGSVGIDDDYYRILEVAETATTEMITKSYKRLALRLHPDKNKNINATEAFQLVCNSLILGDYAQSSMQESLIRLTHMSGLPKLVNAYETLKDKDKRRAYDLTYSRVKSTPKGYPTSTGQTSYSASSTANPRQDDIAEEAAKISAIHAAKAQRAAKWSKTQKAYEDAIFELQREIRKLQNAIKILEEVDKAEDAEERAAKSWSAWFLSPIYKKRVETEEEKESKARERVQRLHNKTFKTMDLKKKDSKLKNYQSLLKAEQEVFDNANRRDDATLFMAEERIRAKREREQQEKDRQERESWQRAWRETYERQRREEAEAAKKRREQQEKEEAELRERQAKEKARQEREFQQRAWREAYQRQRREEAEAAKKRRKQQEKEEAELRERQAKEKARKEQEELDKSRRRRAPTRCFHDCWWDKVEGRMACEKCSVSRYSYLLQCPLCKMKACAACQQQLRPRKRNRGRNKA